MKKQLVFVIIYLCLAAACAKTDILDTPLIAENYDEFMAKVDTLCLKVDKSVCGYIRDAVLLQLPETEPFDQNLKKLQTDTVFKKVNSKTPRELVGLYKAILLGNLEDSRKKNAMLQKDLERLYDDYEKTRHYAQDISVNQTSVEFTKNDHLMLMFSVQNNLPFALRQIVAEAEFYSASDIFLGRAKAFQYPLNPPLKPGGTVNVRKYIPSVPENDLQLIKAAKNLRIRVAVTSVQTADNNSDNETVIILSLPYSYHRMREMLTESELLYKATVKKINAINIK